MWNRRRLLYEIGEGEDAVRWCQDNGLLPRARSCHQEMHLMTEEGLGAFCCKEPHCNVSVALTKNSWFENSKLKPEQVLDICYSFATDASYELAQKEAFFEEEGTLLSSETIADWYGHCREVVTADFTQLQDQAKQIGGEGKIVQVDEFKFGQRKHNRGRHVEGHWVIGLIENDSDDFRMVLCPDNRRGATDIIPIIQQHVAPGTEIHTDAWRSYQGLMDCGMGYDHRVVNHSNPEHCFISTEGVHIQRVEACWRPAKAWLNSKQVTNDTFADYLVEWLWRRDIQKCGDDPFERLLNAVRQQYPL